MEGTYQGKETLERSYDKELLPEDEDLLGENNVMKRVTDESFEDVVRREYAEFGYSDTLDLCIEDCATGRVDLLTESSDFAKSESMKLLLEYFTDIKS